MPTRTLRPGPINLGLSRNFNPPITRSCSLPLVTRHRRFLGVRPVSKNQEGVTECYPDIMSYIGQVRRQASEWRPLVQRCLLLEDSARTPMTCIQMKFIYREASVPGGFSGW